MLDMRGILDRPGPWYREKLWQPHEVGRCSADGGVTAVPARIQIVSERWGVRTQVPYLVYMPERDRLLLLVQCEHQPVVLTSDDRGASWSPPRFVSPELCITPERFYFGVGLAYLGRGRAIFTSARGSCEGTQLWQTRDFGETWEPGPPMPPAFDGKPCLQWDPFLVDRDPQTGEVQRLALAGFTCTADGRHCLGFLRFSHDLGQTWTPDRVVPEWDRTNEIALTRAANGHLVAACRLDPTEANRDKIDHYTGFGVSVSRDDGATWSPVRPLYTEGRHHTSTVVLPRGQMVMTYVVRTGYPPTQDGYPQFGVEAIASRDHGVTWNLNWRHILHQWPANRRDEKAWLRSVQQTSSVLLPDGFVYTAFGTYYRSEPAENGLVRPLDVGLIRWRPGFW
ncbi:MAG: sialidase family protein [Candidatus Latescibacterota bacterium]